MRVFFTFMFGWLLMVPMVVSAAPSSLLSTAVSHFWMPYNLIHNRLFIRVATTDPTRSERKLSTTDHLPIPIPILAPMPNATFTPNVMTLRKTPRSRSTARAVLTMSRLSASPTVSPIVKPLASPLASPSPLVSEKPEAASRVETKVELSGAGGTNTSVHVESHSQSSSRTSTSTISTIKTELDITLTETSCGGDLMISRTNNLKIVVRNSTATARNYAVSGFGSVSVAPGGHESLELTPTAAGSFTISCGLTGTATLTII